MPAEFLKNEGKVAVLPKRLIFTGVTSMIGMMLAVICPIIQYTVFRQYKKALYVFMYLDLNNTVEHAHQIEIEHMQGEQARMIVAICIVQ